MQTLRDGRQRDDRTGGTPRGSARATGVSIAVHLLAVVVLSQILNIPAALGSLFPRAAVTAPPEERIHFVTVAPKGGNAAADGAARAGASRDERSASQRTARPDELVTPTPPLVAPTTIPSEIPPVPAARPGRESLGPAGGPLASGRGPVRGLQPGYVDPRLWVDAPIIVPAPKSDDERLDSAVVTSIRTFADSVAANTYSPNKYERGDWTYTTKGGDKYGIDGRYIRLGKFSIPTALLGLLPLNRMGGNPVAYEREKRLDAIRLDIMEHATAAMNEEEFRKAVKAIRERKDRERKAEQAKDKKAEPKTISDGRGRP
jgi:hypothetical protein